ncbi:hypothetical protein DDP54_11815 [Cellulomonas sp. WB94]|uniref:hypothetical protein n=1 Tax=Cellulomonas sp. WB94 TaxID=2173174 RepID=UPI000D57671D|nr:hypothetical protein [Cellulomonas sp. WB94]PVU83565.1 hypothetical protein DDP54_11815 [Cellulomonas sp. WB94]
MKSNKVLSTGLGLLVAVTGVLGLAACGSDSDDSSSSGSTSASSQAAVDVTDDLQNARKAVADALAEDDSWAQIMLASDVEAPTVKYGLLVVPYTASDAAKRVQGTVTITDGTYKIEAESAATGKTWQIDQDGSITEKTK